MDGSVYKDLVGIDVLDDTHVENCPLGSSENEEEDTSVSSLKVVESNVPFVGFLNQDDQIRDVVHWPEISSQPINEFSSEGYIAQAFPCLFPTGAADLRSLRNKEITASTYFKHLMRYRDDRFATHLHFRFFALNSMNRWTAISNGNVYVRRNQEYADLTVGELKRKLQDDPKILSQLMCQNKNLRGTKRYWKARGRELTDMVEQLRLPTVFFYTERS